MNVLKLKPLVLAMAAFAYSFFSLQVALADDTEIYVPKDLPADQQVRPNILFVLDTSGSMTNEVSKKPKRNRNQVLHEVVHGLIDDLQNKNVNIGFMRFHGNYGGSVTQALQYLTPSNSQAMKDLITDKIPASGNTPMLETYYEAYLYLSGLKPVWGIYDDDNINGTDLDSLQGKQTKKTYKSWKYNSPITHSCQKSHIVYITDGAPTQDTGSNSAVKELVSGAKDRQGKLTNTLYPGSTCNTGTNGACLPHLAEYMANQDIGAEAGLPKGFLDPTNRKQTVTSHFIGFALNLPLLENAAKAGGGKYFTSNNASELTDALQSIIVDITADNSTFVAPSVAVSAYNNLGFRNELYYALFRPSEGSRWPGNVKKYKLITTESNGKLESSIVDRNGVAAIDDETGFFKDSASSFWNDVIDGADIAKGGAAIKLNRTDRNIYTWHGVDKKAGSAGAAVDLKVFKNSTSAQVTNAMLGATDETSRKNIIDWITKNPGRMGDVLHSEPRLVAYTTDEDLTRANTAGSKEDLVMFVGSNEGFIHAIDPKNGEELYSFIPKELLHVPGKYLADNKGYSNKTYGVDGFTSVWAEYGSAVNDSKTATKVNLYAGMRRGGSNYYALDVTQKDKPKLKWVIKGSYNPSEDITSGFEKLGLTFSAPKLADIKINNVKTKVLIFSGGYDIKHDDVVYKIGKNTFDNIPKSDTVGNALYIVNAETGALLWKVGGADDATANIKIAAMTNSMPASPTLVDVNGDGLTDIVYASDLRGQIFRVDINNASATTAISGVQLANFGGTTALANRRFFTSPDVALIRDSGKPPYFTVSIGSGFRESPLNEQTDDRFYMIRDSYVNGSRPSAAPVLTESALTDVSATLSTADSAPIYAVIATLENKIKLLNSNVKDAQNAFEQHKKDIGYTAANEEYLALYSLANQLQKDIDILTGAPYGIYDSTKPEDGTPYNSNFLEQHAAEANEQNQLQSIMVSIQKTLDVLKKNNSLSTQGVADLYAGLLAAQSATEAQANRFVEQENFLLKGSLNAEWTPELIAQTQQMYPGVSFNPASGDFSDYAPSFSAYIDQSRLDYQGEDAYETRQILNAQQAPILDLLVQLAAASEADIPGLLVDLTIKLDSADVDPVSSDIDLLLAHNETAKQQVLNDRVANYASISDSIVQKATKLATTKAEQQAALEYADGLAAGGNFPAHQAAIDAAYAAASHIDTGVSAVRVQINTEYAKLDVADGTISSAQEESLKTSAGFYLRLPRGEKVLSDSVSFRGTVLFSTFSPRGQAISMCGSDVGKGKVYALSLRDSKGMFTKEVDGVEYPIRSLDLKRAGIPPAPAVIVTSKGPVVVVGTEILDLEAGPPVTATHWREK